MKTSLPLQTGCLFVVISGYVSYGALQIGLYSEQRRSRYWSCRIFRGFTFLQHYVSEQVEHVISKVSQRLSLLHRISGLSPHNAGIFFIQVALFFLSLTMLIRYESIRTMRQKKKEEAPLGLRVVQGTVTCTRLYFASSFVAYRK